MGTVACDAVHEGSVVISRETYSQELAAKLFVALDLIRDSLVLSLGSFSPTISTVVAILAVRDKDYDELLHVRLSCNQVLDLFENVHEVCSTAGSDTLDLRFVS